MVCERSHRFVSSFQEIDALRRCESFYVLLCLLKCAGQQVLLMAAIEHCSDPRVQLPGYFGGKKISKSKTSPHSDSST